MSDPLESFRRYRRACRQFPEDTWGNDVFEQWKGDRTFLNDEYLLLSLFFT